MDLDLDAWLDKRDGVVRTSELIQAGISEAEIKRRLRSGEWRRLIYSVIATHRARGPASQIRCRGAVVYAGEGAYLVCLGAAVLRGLPVPPETPIHVTVPKKRSVREQPGFFAHRNALATAPSSYAGFATVTVEASLIGAFGCIEDRFLRRALVIDSFRDGFASAERVAAAVLPKTRRRSELLELLDVCAGSQSEAEIALLLRVIRAAQLPEPTRQHPIEAAGNSYRIDAAYTEERLAIEVDGKAWHFNAERRTADIKRDAELAALGWLTLRFTYEQITNDPDWVAGCIAAALVQRIKIA